MRPLLPSGSLWVPRLLFAVALFSALGTARAADPVREFMRILHENPNVQDERQWTAYRTRLEKAVEAIQRLGDLRRAVLLDELREEVFAPQPGLPPEEENPLGKLYRKARTDLVKRLQKLLRDRLQTKDSARRLAALTFLAEMAREESKQESPGNWTVEPGRSGKSRRFTLSMTDDVRQVLSDPKEEPRVRAAAAEAVAAIAPDAEQTVEDLKQLLQPNRDALERRTAAKALQRLSELLSQARPPQEALQLGADTEQEGRAQQRHSSRLQTTLAALVTAAGLGLGDPKDATVRLLCLQTMRQVFQQSHFHDRVSPPVVRAMSEQIPALIRLLNEDDREVCLAAHQVLEASATVRNILRGIPLGPEDENIFKRPAEEAKRLDGILEALPELKRSLVRKEVRIRLAALYVLETLRDSAEGATDEVITALKDENGFVRWGAVRVLHNMAPRQAEKAAPALAEALKDNNKTVRLAAAQALRLYSAQAKAAVKALEKAIGDAEPPVRRAALHALAAIGPPAQPAAAAVVKALADPEQKPEVRAAAARALGRFGSLDAEAKKALTAALADADAAVRQAASESLLEKEP